MFACSLGTAVPLCLQIETFKPGLYFKLQEGTEHRKSTVSGLQIYVIRGRLDSDRAWLSALLFSTGLSQKPGTRLC